MKGKFWAILISCMVVAVTCGYAQDTDNRSEGEVNVVITAQGSEAQIDGDRAWCEQQFSHVKSVEFGHRAYSNNRYVSTSNVWSMMTPRWGRKGHWAGVGVGYNGLISNLGHMSVPDKAQYMSLKSKSITVSVNLVDFAIVSSSNWALISGLGFEFNNFNFDKNVTLASTGTEVVPDYRHMFEGNVLRKTKLVSAYVNIPLLMEFRFGDYEDGFINFGAIGGLRMQSHTKIKGELPGSDKQKIKNKQHMNNFHYGVTASGGYLNVGLYVTYYPQSIFRSGEGPHVEQINIGIALLL